MSFFPFNLLRPSFFSPPWAHVSEAVLETKGGNGLLTNSGTLALHTAFQEGAKRIEGGGAVLGGPLSGVDPVMQSEGRAPREGLAALSALIGLFSGVNSPMQNKV